MFSLKEAVFRCILLLLGFARLRKHAQNPGRNKDSENMHLGRNRTQSTEYVQPWPLFPGIPGGGMKLGILVPSQSTVG